MALLYVLKRCCITNSDLIRDSACRFVLQVYAMLPCCYPCMCFSIRKRYEEDQNIKVRGRDLATARFGTPAHTK